MFQASMLIIVRSGNGRILCSRGWTMNHLASGLFLALSAAFAIILITQPVGNETQFLLAMTACTRPRGRSSSPSAS